MSARDTTGPAAATASRIVTILLSIDTADRLTQ
jgi:hypothetical protein